MLVVAVVVVPHPEQELRVEMAVVQEEAEQVRMAVMLWVQLVE
jgi:hypothetical protein